MKKLVIAAAVILALLAAAGILIVKNKDSSSEGGASQPNVKIMEDSTMTSDPAFDESLRQIDELKAQLEQLEQEKGQVEFDRAALQAEQENLQKRIASLEEQNRYLRSRNGDLSDGSQRLQGDVSSRGKEIAERDAEIAALNEQIARLEKEKETQDVAIVAMNEQIALLNETKAAHDAEIAARDKELASKRDAMVERGEEIVRLNDRIAHLEAERDLNYTAYQKALAQVNEYRESLERRDRALTSAETAGNLHVNRKGELVNTFNVLPPGQSRNILGIKFGKRDFDIEGTLALMPHWFLVAEVGASEAPDDFVRDEFPGYDADHAFFYDALFGTGLNYRFNRIQSQPNIYINTMLGPAWFVYKDDGDIEMKTYFMWRNSVGFDLTLHKHLQLTGDFGADWIPDYGFTPRITLGLLWSFSNGWDIIGK